MMSYELYLQSVKAHRRLLTGYGENPKADREKWLEPKPQTCRDFLEWRAPDTQNLVSFLKSVTTWHGTFLVTNGSLPKVIENLDPLPTVYVSVDPKQGDIRSTLQAQVQGGFQQLEETLGILPSLDTRTVCNIH